MALINCEECSAEISDKAKACPKCGNPMEKQETKINPCPQCDFELGKGAIACPNCQNKKVIKDSKTDMYREAYNWEQQAYFKSLPNTRNKQVANSSKEKDDTSNNVNNDKEPSLSEMRNKEFLQKHKFTLIGIFVPLAIIALFASNYNTTPSKGKIASSGTSCKSYLRQLDNNKAKFKINAKKPGVKRISGRITDIDRKSSLLYSGRGEIMLDRSCSVSINFSNNFTESDLLKLNKGQHLSARCDLMQAGWVGGIIFTGCRI